MTAEPTPPGRPRATALARRTLFAFILTFIASRIVVVLIMARRIPNMYFFLRGTHVHHLNYGIFLLVAVAAYLLLAAPMGRKLSAAALAYGIALALTFDEFGMWLHLGGLYWQRASYDAVVTIAAVLALIAYGSTLRKWRPRHIITAIALILVLCAFGVVLKKSLKWADRSFGPKLYELETTGPS
ncbi:MAG TPA: hypothetical protein VHY36_15290 [Steroidobacteraceae bacterium]|nr:hypothetical protein [Steroidobacteraceae bacterium]